ncbi:MAG: OmpA/MotB family protein, partial [Rickettsiales bacterium]
MTAFNKKKTDEEDEDWMATYADAITLILCFFVILISVAEPSQAKFEDVKKGMMSEFSTNAESMESPFTLMEESFMEIIDSNNMEMTMAVGKTDRGILLELSSGAFYKPGSAEFKEEAIPVLEEVVEAIVSFSFDYPEYKVEVEGHTDDDPIHTAVFPSNWELSAG